MLIAEIETEEQETAIGPYLWTRRRRQRTTVQVPCGGYPDVADNAPADGPQSDLLLPARLDVD